MTMRERPFAIITGASSGIGYELAKRCAEHGYDLLIAANEPEIHEAALDLRDLGATVELVETDLATKVGGGAGGTWQRPTCNARDGVRPYGVADQHGVWGGARGGAGHS